MKIESFNQLFEFVRNQKFITGKQKRKDPIGGPGIGVGPLLPEEVISSIKEVIEIAEENVRSSSKNEILAELQCHGELSRLMFFSIPEEKNIRKNVVRLLVEKLIEENGNGDGKERA